MHDQKQRTLLVEQARHYLEAAGRPRLVMLAVLSVTLAAGFLASVAMVHWGVYRMPVRYPLAVAFAYATFLGLLWIWLRRQTIASGLADDPEGLLVPGLAFLGATALGKDPTDAAGGDDLATREQRTKHVAGNGGGVGDLGDIGEGLGVLVILVIIAALCTLIVSAYLIVTSPLLLAELLVDGALLGAMSRAVSPDPPPHWSRSVVRRTWLAALVTALVFALVGFGIERAVPGTHTFAEAWAADKSSR